MPGRLLEAVLSALLGAALEALDRWRRDRALSRLGYTRAQLDAAQSRERAHAQAVAIDARPVPDGVGDTVERL